jgi:hypothetical protein
MKKYRLDVELDKSGVHKEITIVESFSGTIVAEFYEIVWAELCLKLLNDAC